MTLSIQEVGLTFGPSTQLEVVRTIGNKEILEVQMVHKVKTVTVLERDSSKYFPIQDIEIFVFEAIENSHSTFCNWRWRRINYFLPQLLLFPFNLLNLNICQHYHTKFRNGDFLLGKHVSLGS
jgi:hypothetical protein